MPVDESNPQRLFLALWPAPEFMPTLLQHAQAWQWPQEARRTRDERLHVTLHFLGNLPTAQLAALRALRARWEGCELALDRGTVWPGGIAVLEASVVPAPLQRLHADLGEELRSLGLALESRPYRPHVTLARKAFGARAPASAPLLWPAGPGYALVRTLGGGRGYETLQAFG